ncbi:sigma-70 family RNA polymerase sigma factor [Paenibacillus oralis]|uniref:Sigma-70 family RNA polymerase sigma factor n=1 Tax=Paenibacillus oralis TaxID=2490856 RepID=A0A3P3U1I3_9BACL|nr:sigma factor-like helix-turn-helix DNA-binding protein [Paenibacillus oralis]RRJ64201.1 sigma-70 family RNA polymerase sigma factor [Paenibacillus oralis]
MDKKETLVVERYRKELYRIGWRMQYRYRKMRRHECSLFDNISGQQHFSETSDTRILVQQLLHSLPEKGKTILHKLYIQELTEAEVAAQLQISQQAVSKWKKKMLQQLSQIANL